VSTITDAQGNLHATADGRFAAKRNARPASTLPQHGVVWVSNVPHFTGGYDCIRSEHDGTLVYTCVESNRALQLDSERGLQTAQAVLHRLDGPAVEGADGYRAWYRHGVRHRADGPAVIAADGTEEWWIDGELQEAPAEDPAGLFDALELAGPTTEDFDERAAFADLDEHHAPPAREQAWLPDDIPPF